jgi:hypothetical protein
LEALHYQLQHFLTLSFPYPSGLFGNYNLTS